MLQNILFALTLIASVTGTIVSIWSLHQTRRTFQKNLNKGSSRALKYRVIKDDKNKSDLSRLVDEGLSIVTVIEDSTSVKRLQITKSHNKSELKDYKAEDGYEFSF